MNFIRRSVRWVLPLLFAAVVAVCTTVPGTLAVISDRTESIVNTFCPDDIVHAEGDVDVYVQKVVRCLGDKTMLPQGFQFTLTNVKTGETCTATSAANGQAVFHLSFDVDDAGVHQYKLSEIKGHVPGVTYSELVYDLRVDVTLAEGMQIAVYMDGEKTNMPQATFENLYDSSAMPVTGDFMPLMWYGAAMLAGIAGIALLIRKVRHYVA